MNYENKPLPPEPPKPRCIADEPGYKSDIDHKGVERFGPAPDQEGRDIRVGQADCVLSFKDKECVESFIEYLQLLKDRKVKTAYEQGYQRGKLDQSWNELVERIKNRIDRMKEDLSQTPGK